MGLGVVAIGVGGYFGLKSLSIRDAACPSTDCDVNGHMRNTSYSELAIDVRVEFMAEHGVPLEALLASGFGPVLLREEIDYLREFKLGTNPRKADSDRDGLKDGDEVKVGDNPLDRDSDGDRIKDGAEHAGTVTAVNGDTVTSMTLSSAGAAATAAAGTYDIVPSAAVGTSGRKDVQCQSVGSRPSSSTDGSVSRHAAT